MERRDSRPTHDDDTVAGSDPIPVAGPLRAPQPGTSFGRYRVEGALGKGGMGMVFAAVDPDLGRRVALKILHSSPGVGSSDPREEARLLREARAIARLAHPNVIEVFDVGVEGGRPFIAMELVDGRTLLEWLKEEEHPVEPIIEVFSQAGRGLAAAHAAGLIHRDFKPANVLLGEDGRVRVLDFGLVRDRGLSSSVSASEETGPGRSGDSGGATTDLTDAGMIMGTPVYMAPEQHMGAAADERSDQFSFCVALYEALYGMRPFVGLSAADYGKAKMDGDLRLPDQPGRTPAWLRRVVVRGLSPRTADRWPSMDALLLALDPRRRRRRAQATVAAAGVVGLVVALGLAVPGETVPDRCAGDGPGISDDWSPSRRQQVRARLEQTGAGFAETTWTRVDASMSGFVEGWTAARTQLCEGSADDDLALDMGLGCLDRQRARAREILDVLDSADLDVVTQAVSLVRGLAEPADCLEPTRVEAPSDAERQEVARVRELIEAAAARTSAGQAQAALDSASEALALAYDTTYRPVEIEARMARGVALSGVGRFEEARETIESAHWDAVQYRIDDVAIESALWLADMEGSRRGLHDEGLEWARHAKAAIDRGGGSDVDEMRRLATVASLLRRKAQFDDAQAQLDTAWVLARSSGKTRGLLAATMHDTAATIAADAGRYGEAREQYDKALELRGEVLGEDHPELAASLDGIGRVQFFTDDPQGALETMQRGLELREQAWGAEHPAVATSLNNLGGILRILGRKEEARERFVRALGIREKVFGEDNPAVAIVLLNLSAVELDLADVDQAIATSQRALRIFENAHGEDHPDVCMVLNNLGVLLMEDGQLEAALDHHRRALAIRQRILPDPHPDRALSHSNVARVLVRMGRTAEGLESARRAVELYTAVSGPEHSDTALTQMLVGWALVDLGRSAEAVDTLEGAMSVFDREENRAFATRERVMFHLARALWASDIDRRRACGLARTVAERIADWGDTYQFDRDEVAAWLRRHPC